MAHNVAESFSAKVEMIKKGQIVDATEKFLAPNGKTTDFDGTITKNKEEMLTKMKGFAGAIAKVNGITLLHSSVSGNVSFAEFNIDFDMKDGSKILWHEIIRSVWENGLITDEQYFKG
jgi:DNA polymerase III alpha subunit (gram-positive type)